MACNLPEVANRPNQNRRLNPRRKCIRIFRSRDSDAARTKVEVEGPENDGKISFQFNSNEDQECTENLAQVNLSCPCEIICSHLVLL